MIGWRYLFWSNWWALGVGIFFGSPGLGAASRMRTIRCATTHSWGGYILCSSDGCPATGSRVLNVLCDRRNAQMHASINNCLASRVSGLVCRISNWLRLALPGVFPGPTLFHPPSTTSQVLNQAEKTHEPGLVSPGSSTTPCRLFKLFAHVPRTPGGFSVQSPDWIDWAVALSLTRWHHLGQM